MIAAISWAVWAGICLIGATWIADVRGYNRGRKKAAYDIGHVAVMAQEHINNGDVDGARTALYGLMMACGFSDEFLSEMEAGRLEGLKAPEREIPTTPIYDGDTPMEEVDGLALVSPLGIRLGR